MIFTAGKGNESSANIKNGNAKTKAEDRRNNIEDEVRRIRIYIVKSDIIESESNDSANP
jgi:hypothetical protein